MGLLQSHFRTFLQDVAGTNVCMIEVKGVNWALRKGGYKLGKARKIFEEHILNDLIIPDSPKTLVKN